MEKKSRISLILNIIQLAVSLFLMIGVRTVFHACVHEDGSFGSCHYAEMAVFAAAIALSAQSLILLTAQGRRCQIPLSGAICTLAVITALIPNVFISLCMMPAMRCLAVMRPCVICCSAAVAVIAIINMIVNIKGRKADE